jgi:hypothetical protein
MRFWRTAPFAALVLLLCSPASAQSTTQSQAREENISEKVINPIAFLTRLTAENKDSPSLWDTHGEENQVESQLVMPFMAFAKENLARIKTFFTTSKPDGTHGLSESEIFDLVLFPRSWGTLGAGITAQLTAETSSQLGSIAPGPAVGVVARHGKWKYGFFNQNFLSDTVAQTELQPILAYAFNQKWSAEIGDAQYTYDWKKDRVTTIPLSGQLNRILSLAHQEVHLFFQGQYNAKNDSGSTKWTLTSGISLIVEPTPRH